MTTKTLSTISAVLTAIFVILIGFFIFFMIMIALNGYGDREGTAAVVINLICSGGGAILSAILAGWLTRLVIDKFTWNNILAVILSIFAGTTLGGLFTVASLVLSVIAAEILWNSR